MAYWQFTSLRPNDSSGTSTVEDNFANEERTSVEILVRETLQNPLDARDGDQLVQVRYDIVSLETGKSDFLGNLFSSDCLKHLTAGKLLSGGVLPRTIDFLVVEDFGTSGLEGNYEDSSTDGSGENWNAFWFREGEGAKPTKSNGGAGQGKITLYTASEIRSVLALTNRVSDSKKLLFGCCRFRQNYKLPGDPLRWSKEGRWGATNDPEALSIPIQKAAEHDVLERELGLQRGTRSGTSFIVPLPIGISLDAIEKAVVNEFYFPITRGRLEVTVGGINISSKSISKIAANLGNEARHVTQFRSFIDEIIRAHIGVTPMAKAKSSWNKDSKLIDDNFDNSELNIIKKKFENQELIDVDFPIRVSPAGKDPVIGTFRVLLKQDYDIEQSHELFIRQDLGIDGERRLRGSRRIQPTLALTFIDDTSLSAFLAAAEEPTHRTWNAKRLKLVSQYKETEKVLNSVRNAALRLVEFLTPAGKRDDTALSLYFADPTAAPAKRKGGTGATHNPNAVEPTPIPIIPKPKAKAVEFIAMPDGFKIKANPAEMMLRSLPLWCEVEIAYATTFGDAFAQWDAADFWVNDEKFFPIKGAGYSDLVRDGNQISFNMIQPVSDITISGFDSNRQLEVRITYREAVHATDI